MRVITLKIIACRLAKTIDTGDRLHLFPSLLYYVLNILKNEERTVQMRAVKPIQIVMNLIFLIF